MGLKEKGEIPCQPQDPQSLRWMKGDMWEILKACWALDPAARPTMTEVVKQMEDIETLFPL
jgi:hypothetical protein